MSAENWIEIFRAGTHTAASGERVTISAADVDAIAKGYDASYHEAPIVIGHPADNAPAWGWVAGLKSEGGKLLAQLKQVAPEFREMVNAGLFKKRSASFYKDLDGRGQYLRHVGFLGAQPPAVKALAAIQLAEGDAIAFDFDEERSEEKMDESKLRQMFSEFAESIKDGIKKALGRDIEPTPGGGDGVNQKIADAVKAATDQVTAQFSEQMTALKGELTEQQKQLRAADETARRAGIRNFADRMKAEGRWVPAFERLHLVEFMESLPAGADAVVEFSEEKDGKTVTTKVSPLQFFQEFLTGLPKLVEFRELTAGVTAGKQSSKVIEYTPGSREATNIDLAERASAIADEKDIPYGEALERARRELAS
jgi:hypothetical protein